MVQTLGTPLWRTVWPFLTKLNILLSSDLAIKILAIYPSLYLHTHTHQKKKKKLYRNVNGNFILSCQKLTELRYLLIGEITVLSIRYYFYLSIKYYSTPKRTELSSHENIWRNVKYILPSQRIPSEKVHILYDSNYITLQKRKNYGDHKNIMQERGYGI